MWKDGENYWMEREEIASLNEHNDQFMVRTPVEDIRDGRINLDGSMKKWLNATEVLQHCDVQSITKLDSNMAASWLKKRGVDRREHDKRFFVDVGYVLR